MSDHDSWEVILGGNSSATVLVVDCSAGIHREWDFAELEASIRSGYRYLRVKLPAVGHGKWFSSHMYVGTWSEDIRRTGNPVAAVLGSRIGSVYAAAIADRISHWQRRPTVILFDPQVADIGLVKEEFRREVISLNSLFSSDEIERAENIGYGVLEPPIRGVSTAVAEMFEDYLETIKPAFERVGLGEPRNSKLIEPFKSYVSLISAASQIDQRCAWKRSTVIISSDCPHVPDDEFPDDCRRIKLDVKRADLFRSDLVTTAIADLLRPRSDSLLITERRSGISMSVTADLLAPSPVRDVRDPLLRLTQLFDGNDCELLNSADETEVRVAVGRVNGARVIAYCTNATKMGGALGITGSVRIIEAIERAVRRSCPVVGIWHSGGAKLADGVESMDAVGQMFAAMTRASGRVPQISVVVGPAAGAAAYGPALTDLIIMAPAGRVFVTGPEVVKTVTGEQIDMEGLGGPEAHSRRSGVAHVTADSEEDAYQRARNLVTFFTRPGLLRLDRTGEEQDLRALLPESPRRAYDVRPLVRAILDPEEEHGEHGGGFAELQARWAPNIVVGLGRLVGRAIGVVANNPIRMGGCLDSLSAEKASRFVRMCDALGVPLLVVVDLPGYLPGVSQEWNGVVRRGAKLLHAFAEAAVPRVTLVTRKSYGGGYIAMNSRSLGATAVFAWPEAEIAVMGAEAAVGILHRKQLAAAADHERDALKNHLIAEQTRIAGGVDRAMAIGVLDEVVLPHRTRRRLAEAFAAAPGGRGHHGNIPL